MALTAATVAGAVGVLILAGNIKLSAIAMAFYGAGNGIIWIARGPLPLSLFRAERYPAIMGRLARPSSFAQAAAPMMGGMLIASQGSHVTVLVLFALAAINVLLALANLVIVRQAHQA